MIKYQKTNLCRFIAAEKANCLVDAYCLAPMKKILTA